MTARVTAEGLLKTQYFKAVEESSSGILREEVMLVREKGYSYKER